MKRFLVACCLALLCGCGGGGSSDPAPLAVGSFWADDFTTDGSYQISATKVAEGTHCYVYVEQGQTVTQAAINAIVTQFDNVIHPDMTAAFGSEPNPGIDGDPKIHIVLQNVRDGFNPHTNPSFVAGYFDSNNEYALTSQNAHSNQKEVLFMNINPAVGLSPASTEFFAVMAHEFQHLIHWEQKTHLRNVTDDTWLDEAMSQVARTFCGFGPDYDSIDNYQQDLNKGVNHSLANFDQTVGNYGMVYMWAQYYKDRVGSTIFRTMLQNNLTGIASVNAALTAAGSTKDFAATFRDWAVANAVGDGTTRPVPAGHPEWSYSSIDTSGTHNGVTLQGFFPLSRRNPATLQALDQWSLGYYSYTPSGLGATTGTVTWNSPATTTTASFIEGNLAVSPVIYDMAKGTQYPFTTTGYLINANASFASTPTVADTVAHTAVVSAAVVQPATETAITPRTPREVLAAMNASPVVRQRALESGRPQRAHVDASLREREKILRAQGMRPPF